MHYCPSEAKPGLIMHVKSSPEGYSGVAEASIFFLVSFAGDFRIRETGDDRATGDGKLHVQWNFKKIYFKTLFVFDSLNFWPV